MQTGNKSRQQDLNPRPLTTDTMLSCQLSQKFTLLGNGPNSVYQAI